MEINLHPQYAEGYKSRSQIARRLTESWAADNLYCPRCGKKPIEHFPNNRAVADFFCPVCQHEFEMKSKNGKIGKKVADGAYDTFIKRITANNNPDFFFMNYSYQDLCVNDLWFVPAFFFVPSIVEKRKPLGKNAQRANWVGCNILFDDIPAQGKIAILLQRQIRDQDEVMKDIASAEKLQTNNIEARGWMLDVLFCINKVGKKDFTLEDMYCFEKHLQGKYPANHNIRPKIRQQLQQLRDRGIIEFVGRGNYRRIY
ncbi:MAG: restriction endonuclease [Clostridia bacterium]|nr:restriction endonuclease [Clostridia bacterium]